MNYKRSTTTQTEPNRPTYIAYHVQEAAKEGGKERWVELGAFFSHRDGSGGNLVLDALPINFSGKIVLRAPSQKSE